MKQGRQSTRRSETSQGPAAAAAGLFALASSTCAASAHGIAPVPSTHKLTATSPGVLRAFPVRPAQLRAARGEWECFQIVVRADNRPIKSLKLAATSLATNLGRFIARSNVQIFREHFVYVPKPSGNAELKPLWWSDALIPLNAASTSTCEAHKAIAFWVAVRAPEDAEAGEYYGAIDFSIDGEPRTLAVTLDVEKASMPAPTMRGTVAVYYDVLRDWYKKSGREFSDQDWDEQKRRYYDFLLGYRINAYDLPVPWDDPRAAKYLQDSHVTSVRLPPLGSPEMPLALRALEAARAKRKAFYYRIDEPTPEAYPQVLEASRQLRALDPEIKHLVTIHPNDALKNAVDIWCPNIGDATGVGWIDLERLEAERRKGRETWWYTMVEPKFPYPTWLVDDDAIAVRSYGWMMARWGISGFVYSMAHGWGPDPFKSLQSFADTSGDGTLVYPGELVGLKGPIPSVRLMLLRDAIEDYELLKLLPEESRKTITRLNIASGLVERPEQPIRVGGTGEPSRPEEAPEPNDDEQENAQDSSDPDVQRSFIFEALRGGFPMLDFFPSPTQPESSVLVQAAPAPRLDGLIEDAAWSKSSRVGPRNGYFARFLDDPLEWPADSFYLARDPKYLYAGLRLRDSSLVREDQWCALEIAPRDGREKWRFVLTLKSSLVTERYTREGRFRVEGIEWKAVRGRHVGYQDIEFQIPLSLIDGDLWRVNALRRVLHTSGARVTLRAEDDAGDARLMPLFRLRPQSPAKAPVIEKRG